MFASRLFWKLFLTYTVLTLLTAVGFVLVVSQRHQHILESQHQRRLHDLAVVLRDSLVDSLPEHPTPEFQGRLKRLADSTDTRMSLILPDGSVVGDSAYDPFQMDDHSNRPEIIQASRKTIGLAQRESPTLEIPMMYVAVPIVKDGKTLGYARVASDMATIRSESAALQTRVFVAAGFVSCIAVLLTYLIVVRIVKPILSLTSAAQALAEGETVPDVDIPNHDEIGMLAGAFNSMSRQLTDRIHELQGKTQELQENSDRLGTVLAGMIEGVIAVDRSEKILFANRAARPLMDLSSEEIIGRPIWEAIRNKTVHDVVRATLSGRQKQSVEFDVPR
ncbi:MAG: HAMP domain-containing protein, partial [Planctomycetaceae bacterium]|nr:HAMP domain-containing protein [Planctomycetaceae bacterium]